MTTNRRSFLQSSAAAGLGLGVAGCNNSAEVAQAQTPAATGGAHPAIAALKPMTAGVKPITREERAARVQKAQRLMAENKISAIVLEGGSSMFYFTGVRWGLSERPFVAVIPAKGDIAWVCPGFEEQRARELVAKNAEVRFASLEVAGVLR
jgi:Xaa-Pro dipeptidase